MLYGGLCGAESVEDFTEKMADNETARAAIDAAMRGQAENENAASEEGAVDVPQGETIAGSDYVFDEHHGKIIDAVRRNFNQVKDMTPVKTLAGTEFQKTASDSRGLREKVISFFNSIGNRVSRADMGEIELNTAGVRDSLSHGYGKLKAVTFAALPEVVQNGRIVFQQGPYEGHDYDSYIIAAPVKIEGVRNPVYVGALVIKDVNTQRYKLHEVLTIKNDGTPSFQSETQNESERLRGGIPSAEASANIKTGITADDGITGVAGTSKDSILQTDDNSNNFAEGQEDSAAVQKGGDLSQIGEAAENGTEEKSAETADAGAGDSQNVSNVENGPASAEAEERSFADAQDDRATEKDSSAAAQDDRGSARNDKEAEIRNDPEDAKRDLLEFGEGLVKNDTGEYRMKIRLKKNGLYLASIDVNGKRDAASTFHSAEEAADWAEGYVAGQTQAKEDAALDRHRSKKERAPTITESLFGQVDPKKEADRRLVTGKGLPYFAAAL